MDEDHFPRLSPATLTLGLMLMVQAAAIIIWSVNEHSQRVELEHRFEQTQRDLERDKINLRALINDKNTNQDLAIAKIDEFGTRALTIVIERQATNGRRLDALERSMDVLMGRGYGGGSPRQ